MWRAIIRSSSVGMTHAETRAFATLIRGPPCAFAVSIDFHADPSSVAAETFANRHRVLADASGENEWRPVRRARRPSSPARDGTGRRKDRWLARAWADRCASSVRMSLEMPETPSRPDSLYSSVSIARASMPSSSMQIQHHAGIELPRAVPIIRPSSAVKPMVVATLLPVLHRAHARAVAEVRHHDAAARRGRVEMRPAPTRCIRRTGRGIRSGARRAR